MTKQQIMLDTQELLHEMLGGLRIFSAKPLDPAPAPMLLSRHWTVFQVPSASTPNLIYYVVGSKKDGWRCSCVGWQSHGHCYHAEAVMKALEAVRKDKRSKPR